MIDSKRKTVLITGASGGIGIKITKIFAENGWDVLYQYNSNFDSINELDNTFKYYNIWHESIKSDFSEKEQLNKFIEYIKEYNIDCLVNNAGVSIKDELSLDKIINLFTINTFSAMLITNSVFPGMKNRGFGRIVNVSSIGAKYGSSVSSLPYGCSKLAMEGITKTFAREGAIHNILVNTVRPGVVNTDFHKKVSKNIEERVNLIPMKKMINIDDVVNMIYYLGSEKNNFITNETISISGGE